MPRKARKLTKKQAFQLYATAEKYADRVYKGNNYYKREKLIDNYLRKKHSKIMYAQIIYLTQI